MKKVLSFLKELRNNNEREWFNTHKDKYQAAMAEFEQFIELLISEIAEFDPDIKNITPKDCIFRIYNDVRFAKNKPPYKEHFGAWIIAGGKKVDNTKAGYYIHIEPGASFVGGGMYHPQAPQLQKIRKYIEHNAKELKTILSSKEFKKYYPGMWDEDKLSRPPAGFDKDHPDIELIKYKSYVVMNMIPDEMILSNDLLSHLAKTCKAQQPFNDFLNDAVG